MSRLIAGCLVCLCSSTGCGSDGAGGPDLGRGDVDGDRLVGRNLSFPGGSPIQVGWYDQELAAPCDFRAAADGQLRCVPQARIGTLYYSSPDCAGSSVMQVEPLCGAGAAAFALILDFAACPARARVFRLGEPDTSGRVYVLAGGGECIEVTQADGFSYHAVEEVAPGELVAAEHTPVGAGRLQRYVDVAQDGAQRLTSELRDTELADDCTFTRAADGSLRCVPGETSLDTDFTATSDTTCAGEAALVSPCVQSGFAVRDDPDACDESTLVYELGEALPDGLALYREIDGVCQEVENELQGAVMRWVGPEVDPSELVGAELELSGDGRVQERWARLADGTRVFHDFWDSELETTCAGRMLQDGTIVCSPSTSLVVDSYEYFSDPECDQPRSVVVGGQACAAEGAIAYAYVRDPPECPEYRFHRIAGEVAGDIFILNRDTSECRALTGSERATLGEVGEEIDPGSFEVASPGSVLATFP